MTKIQVLIDVINGNLRLFNNKSERQNFYTKLDKERKAVEFYAELTEKQIERLSQNDYEIYDYRDVDNDVMKFIY